MKGILNIGGTVEHIGMSAFRALNCANLRTLRKVLVIHYKTGLRKPIAVLIPYEQFIRLQELILQISSDLRKRENIKPK